MRFIKNPLWDSSYFIGLDIMYFGADVDTVEIFVVLKKLTDAKTMKKITWQ